MDVVAVLAAGFLSRPSAVFLAFPPRGLATTAANDIQPAVVRPGFTADTTPTPVPRIARRLGPHRVCVVSRHQATTHFRRQAACHVSPGDFGLGLVQADDPAFEGGGDRGGA